jgi:hypothetical protein
VYFLLTCHSIGVAAQTVTSGPIARRTSRLTPSEPMMFSGSSVSSRNRGPNSPNMSEISSGTMALNVLSSEAATAAVATRAEPSGLGAISPGALPSIAFMKLSTMARAAA